MSPSNHGQAPNVAAVDTASLKRPAAVAIASRSLQAKKTRVIVLGAGMSGLACARELQQRGYQVLVVEARDRLGGRLKGGVKTNDKEGGHEGMKTLPNNPLLASPNGMVLKPIASKSRSKKDTTTPIDLGGALIHGIDDNPIYAITEQMGIPTFPVSDCLLFDQSGWPVDTKEDERIATIFNECLEETFERVAAYGATPNDNNVDAPSSASAAVISAQRETTIDAVSDNPIASGQSPATSNSPTVTTVPQHEEEKKQDRGTASPPTLRQDKQAAKTGDEVENSKQPASNNNGGALDSAMSNTSSKSSKSGPGIKVADSLEPFGDVFEKVCKEKGAPTSYPLFQWHQANLEVGCGASFPNLGYKWNDDEPYGFDGDHCAVKTSWKPIVEGLAEGIDVLYQSPVTQVVMVVPDPPPAPPSTLNIDADEVQPEQQQQQQLHPASFNSAAPQPDLASISSSKNKRKRPLPPVTTTPLPSRRSRRIRGDDASARRSSRANKGQKVDRFLVAEFSKDTYEGNKPSESRRKKQREETEEVEDIHTTVQVTLEDGTVLEAEAVVCTLPLGVLKLEPQKKKEEEWEDSSDGGGGIRFYPPLSEQKQNAIQRLGCGLLNKVVLSFSHVFWQDSDFLGLAHPANSYLVLNAATFTDKPILSFMYGGNFAKEIESWTDNEIVADCLEVLRIICGKRDIPTPLDYAVTRWGHERYSRMSFSYVPPGVDGMQEYKAMNEAVYDPLVPRKPVVMFAGEHTTPFHPSTIHGAFLSGIREAYRLDLVVEAEANGHLEFEDDHTYQYTFGVRRQFQTVRSPVARAPRPPIAPKESSGAQQQSPDTKTSGSKRQHRRRGAASVMNLRERPNSSFPDEEENLSSTKRKKQQRQLQPRTSGRTNGLLVSPAKRSRRSVHAMQKPMVLEENSNIIPLGASPPGNLKTAPIAEAEGLAEKKHLASLESRTLMRALESYGHNYPYISSVVLPVNGNTVPSARTLPQVRARCQQLIRSIMSSASTSISNKLLASWVAKEVSEPPPVDHKPKNKLKSKPPFRRRESAPAKPRVEGSRKSSRHQKERQLMNL